MRRLSFLPAFFTVLVATFVFAVAWKVRTYSKPESRITARQDSSSSLSGAPAPSPARSWDSSAGEGAGAPLSDGSQAGTVATTSRASIEREQRYRELLNAPPPGTTRPAARPGHAPNTSSSTVAAKETKPSLFSRIVAPIVNAFGGGSNAQQRPTQPPTQGNKPSDSTDRTKEKEPKDPNSDVTAPQLVAVEFSPPSVHDGEETLLAITATDDLSGVRTISGNVISPSGALQGFALQREGEASNRYLTK